MVEDIAQTDSALEVECPNCSYVLRPDDDTTKWAPPTMISSVGSIICPSCGKTNDFLEWRIWTAGTSDSDKETRVLREGA